MITSKQRAYLRALANKENALFQIGKGGITDTIAKEISDCLEKRELVKITVLETAMLSAREAANLLCDMTGAQGVQCVGNKLVLYKESENNKKIVLP